MRPARGRAKEKKDNAARGTAKGTNKVDNSPKTTTSFAFPYFTNQRDTQRRGEVDRIGSRRRAATAAADLCRCRPPQHAALHLRRLPLARDGKTLSLGYDESKLAAVLASFILHKPRQRSSFIKAALTTLESIGELEQFLVKHKKDYVDLHRTTEQERDSIEHEITVFVKACKEQIDILKSSINDEESDSKGWLGLKGDHSNADTIAHKHGVVLILSERLHSVTRQFDQLRGIRFQEAINRTIPRRRPKRVDISKSTDNSHSNKIELKEPNDSGLRDPDEIQADPIRVQQQLLDDETRALQVELTSLLDAAQETETKMVEMSALNHLMSTHVLQQAQQIEFLYEQAVEATNNVELGNKELSQAIQRNSSSRTFLLLFLFVMTFSIIFLDWYS
ncbi:hypothetical protein Vadar_028675 [Vaccinium darrowii]|uniref:Uncharacterized protein n=1 Tax=Vaccinium darrowii TaxID=229202 RepID=A0ACB7X4T4_9ERIC|nr:hypothetical protein Vadar_028675 [Vaccinium darrowii]